MATMMTRIRSTFPYRVHRIDHLWIPLADGARLGARLWLPEGPDAAPAPAIIEYNPYRKNDLTAPRDEDRYAYLAGCGYACLHIELRGSGESDGVLLDEYTAQEQDDALAAIAWVAAQPWCSGAVGMIGVSWSGFNGLQVAARRPPALRAVISACSTDDRYADDVHYVGGCLNACDALVWASIMLTFNALPPDPEVYGEGWRATWMQRLDQAPPFIDAWLSHQRRDAYWRHASICEEYTAIACPVYMVGGWADGYSNAIPRTLAGLGVPRLGIIGPWGHGYPNSAVPGPQVGFLQETVRWFNQWLKGIDTGIMDAPMLRAWIQEWATPTTSYITRPGRWVAEPTWPPTDQPPRLTFLASGGLLAAEPDEMLTATVGTALAHGGDGPTWCPYGAPGDFADDQRREDALALCFTSAPCHTPEDLLGFPVLHAELSSDAPIAMIAVRLCDIAPSGESLLVSYGLLNLTHRDSHAAPTPLIPGQRYQVHVPLNAVGHQLAPGHRWRVAIAPSYWPIAWPAPAAATITIHGGAQSYLELPARAPRPGDALLPAFGEPEQAPALALINQAAGATRREHSYDRISRTHTRTEQLDRGRFTIAESGMALSERTNTLWRIVEGDPLSAFHSSVTEMTLARGAWGVRIETESTLTADADAFHVTTHVSAYEGARRVHSRAWARHIPRDLV